MPINSEQVLVNSVLSNSSPAPSKLLQIGETGERAELAFCKWGEERKSKEESQLGDVFTKQGIWGAESPVPRAGDTEDLIPLSCLYFWIFLIYSTNF